MTAPEEQKFDPELAWDLQDWRGVIGEDDPPLSRAEVKSLAAYLTEKGYTKGKTSGLTGLLSTLEETGAKLVDEFGPLIDSLRKPK